MAESAPAQGSTFRSTVHCGDSTMRGLTPSRVDNETFVAQIQFGFQVTDEQLTEIRSICAAIDGVHHRRGKQVKRALHKSHIELKSRIEFEIHVGNACSDRKAATTATAIATEVRDELQRWFHKNPESTRRPDPAKHKEPVSVLPTRHQQVTRKDAKSGYLNNPFDNNR